MDAATETESGSLRRGFDLGGLGEERVVVDPGGDPDGDPRKRFNGPDPNGPATDYKLLRQAIRADSFNGSASGLATNRLGLDGGQLRARRTNGVWLTGAALVNGVFTGNQVNGQGTTLKIFAAQQDTTYPDLWQYDVRVRQADGTYYPACGYSGTTARRAYVMPDRFDFNFIIPGAGEVLVTGTGNRIADANAITFACRGYSYAKCEEFYPPWIQVPVGAGSVSLANTHVACVRALRSDTCGDGISHTSPGVLLNVYDALGYVPDTETWALEAVWDTNGAVCINRPDARQDPSTINCLDRTIPACAAHTGPLTTEYQELPDANQANMASGNMSGDASP